MLDIVFFVWMKTGSYPPDSNEYEKIFYEDLSKGYFIVQGPLLFTSNNYKTLKNLKLFKGLIINNHLKLKAEQMKYLMA